MNFPIQFVTLLWQAHFYQSSQVVCISVPCNSSWLFFKEMEKNNYESIKNQCALQFIIIIFGRNGGKSNSWKCRENQIQAKQNETCLAIYHNDSLRKWRKKQIIKMLRESGSDKKERDDKATAEVTSKLHMSCVFNSFFQLSCKNSTSLFFHNSSAKKST